MTSKFRVRFVDVEKCAYTINSTTCEQLETRNRDIPQQRRKGRFGCQECKMRHVKCDETFPVCLRCQQRGAICRSAARNAQWQLEVPWLAIAKPLSTRLSNVNNRLLQYWLEKGSQIMTIDVDTNPFSFDLIKYLESSQSLVHVVQSLSVAHENYFGSSSLIDCLKERGLALAMAHKDLSSIKQPTKSLLLTVLLLGLSSAWVHHQTGDDFGQEHLRGARAMLELWLTGPDAMQDPFMRLAVATYLTWDQATAFLPHSQDQFPLHTENLFTCVQSMRSEYNGMTGYTIGILYLLGQVGRYCRTIIDGGLRDFDTEESLEDQLLRWTSAGNSENAYLVNDSFRKHGLIMLYRTIVSVATPTLTDLTDDGGYRHEDTIRQYATDILDNINKIPDDSRYHCFLGQPLLTAGAELSHVDSDEREKVREKFRRIFSSTRIPANLYAIEHLNELWEMRDEGRIVFWMSHLLQKDRIFVLC